LLENDVPDWAGFSFGFKAQQPAHSGLYNGCHNTEDGRKDPARRYFIGQKSPKV